VGADPPLPIQPDALARVRRNAHNEVVPDAHRRLGATLRRLVDAVIDPALDEAGAAELDAALSALLPDRPGRPASRYADEESAAFPALAVDVVNRRGTHPFFGCLAPLGSEVALDTDGDDLRIRLTFDARHEGMPGCVHGGHVMVGFDYALGQTAASAGIGGPTGTMTVRFRRPTPIGVPVAYTGRAVGREGRRTTVTGELRRLDDDTVCAEAEAVFVSRAETGADSSA
jgi:acyl-coenzyme A thioesterase PaaI-like protein